jgi:hypothetical protein
MADDASLGAAEREAPHLSANERAAGRVSPTLLAGYASGIDSSVGLLQVALRHENYDHARTFAERVAHDAEALAAELRAVLRS